MSVVWPRNKNNIMEQHLTKAKSLMTAIPLER
jgi:hypothetical protein